MFSNLFQKLKKPKNLILSSIIGTLSVAVIGLGVFALLTGAFDNNQFLANETTPSEPNCEVPNNPNTFNPYTTNNQPSPSFNSPCQDMKMLSHMPITQGNPREKTLVDGQVAEWLVYYNWGVAGSERIQNPNVKLEMVSVGGNNTQDIYELRGVLTGTLNGQQISVSSADRGGHLRYLVPKGTRLVVNENKVSHEPDAIERDYVLDVDNEIAPYNNSEWQKVTGKTEAIPDNQVDGVVSNRIYTAWPGVDFSSNPGFTIKAGLDPDYCDANGSNCNYGQSAFLNGGFLDYGWVRGQIKALEPVQSTPSYTIQKTCRLADNPQVGCDSDARRVGQEVEYEITVVNTGDVDLTNVVITDRYNTDNDGRIELVNITDNDDNGGIGRANINTSNQTLTWPTISVIPVGESRSVTFTATVSDEVVNGELIVNTATAKPDDLDELSDTAEFEVIRPTLDALKTCFVLGTSTPCDSTTLEPGDDITYEIRVFNNSGVTITNPEITDSYDRDKLTNIRNGVPAPEDITAYPLVWKFAEITAEQDANNPLVVKFDATIKEGLASRTEILNEALVTADDVDDIDLDYVFDIVVTDIKAQKTCNLKDTENSCLDAKVSIGDEITYFIKVKNDGDSDLENVKVVDTYDGTKIKDITAISDNYPSEHDEGADKITWTIGTMTPGQEITLSFNATVRDTVKNGEEVVNLAVVSADDKEDINLKNSFPLVLPEPLLRAEKNCVKLGTSTPCDRANLKPGDSVVYTIQIRNIGGGVAKDVVLVDDYPQDKITNIRNITPKESSIDSGKITWPAVDIAIDDSRSYTFTATIKSNVANGTKILNLGEVTSSNHPKTNVRNEFPVQVVPAPPTKGTTPSTGGLEIAGIVLLASGLGFVIYYTKKHPKWAQGFIPKRSKEMDKDK